MEPQYLGNTDLLTLHKVGFLASRKVNPTSVIPTINWANKVSHDPNVAIVSGFQSTLEREVLDIALKGTCGIIYVLNRSPSAINANIRNHYITNIADELTFASVNEVSSLHQLIQIDKFTLLL